MIPGPDAIISPAIRIIYEVADKYGISRQELVGHDRGPMMHAARREAAARLRKERRMSSLMIGRFLGDRHHSSILYMLKEEWREKRREKSRQRYHENGGAEGRAQRRGLPPKIKRECSAPSKEWLEQEYWGKDRTAAEIAQDLNRCETTVLSWLSKYGIRKRTNSESLAMRRVMRAEAPVE